MRLAPLLALLLSPALAAQPTGSTITSGGGPASDVGESVAADVLSGEVAVVGTFEQTATFGAVSVTSADAPTTRSDAFVVKYGADGVAQWARRMGTGVFNDFGAGVAIGGGGVYVSGYFTGIATFDGGANPSVSLTTRNDFDAFLAKYSYEGDLLWVQQAGGPEQDTGRGVAVDSEGRALWVGSFTGTSTWGSGAAALTRTSAGSSDGFLARYLPDGTLDRLLTVGGDESDDLRSVSTSPFFPFSPTYATGTFRSVAFFGATPLQSRGLSDVAVIRVGDDNSVEWARQVGGSGNDYARGVALGRDGNVGVGGSFENTLLVGTDVLTSAGASDAFLAVYDFTGAEVGARRGGG
ncbi:MAG TPA: SBBP repeat-containing protein, partial [Rubricoccaceae bacterium]